MKKIMVALAIVTALITGCTSSDSNYNSSVKNGITYHKNRNVPSEKLNIKLKKVRSIKTDDESFKVSHLICSDDESNTYIFDSGNSKIKKFDKDGKYITEFGNSGQGPGEYNIIGSISFENNSIKVMDTAGGKIIFFDKSGKFISEDKKDNRLPSSSLKVSDNKYITIVSEQITEDGTPYFVGGLSLSDGDFNKLTMLWEKRIKFDLSKLGEIADMFKSMPSFAVKEGRVYIAPKTTDRYIIEEFNSDGKKTGQIERSYSQVKYTKEELKNLQESTAVMVKVQSDDGASSESVGKSTKTKYKPSIDKLDIDKEGRLWVMSPSNKDGGFDIFKDGKFLDRINPEIAGDMRFIGDYIYVINYENNSVDIYSY